MASTRKEIRLHEAGRMCTGFDHGAGHPLLLLCDAKAPNLRNNKAFKI